MRGEQRVLGRQVERRILGDASPAPTRELIECVGGHRGHRRRLAHQRRQECRPIRRHVAGGAAKARGERLGGGVPQLLLQPEVRQRHHLHLEQIAKRQLAVRRLAHRRPHLVELRLQLRLEHIERRAAVAWDVVAHDKERGAAARRWRSSRGAQLEVDFEHEAEQVRLDACARPMSFSHKLTQSTSLSASNSAACRSKRRPASPASRLSVPCRRAARCLAATVRIARNTRRRPRPAHRASI